MSYTGLPLTVVNKTSLLIIFYFIIFILCSHFVPNLTFGAPLVKCLRKKVPNAFFGELKQIVDKASVYKILL